MAPGFSVEYGIVQTLAGGTRLYADVYTPAAPGRYPTLLMRLPYGSEIASAGVYRHPAWYAAEGFCVVVQEVRGCGRSEGDFYPLRDEKPDTLAAIEWAAALPRANGRLGMYGFSYQGAVQLQAAAVCQGGPLLCIAPSMTAAGFYNGWHYEGGAPLYGSTLGWALQLAGIAALHDGRESDAAKYRAAATNMDTLFSSVPPLPELLRDVPFARDWFSHECEDGYWLVQKAAPAQHMPALWSAGWYDTFLEGTLAAYSAAASGEAEQSLLIGPWQHMPWSRTVGQRDFGPHAWSPLDSVQLAFFNSYLRDCSPRSAQHIAFVTGLDAWRSFPAWPPFGQTIRYHLSSDGDAAGQPGGLLGDSTGPAGFDTFVSEPLSPVASLGGHGSAAGRSPASGCFEQSPIESRREVLTYTTAPLERDLLVAGPVAAQLTVASSGTDCDWVARLCEVDPTGRSFNVTQGALRSRFRSGYGMPEPLVPDVPVAVRIAMRQCCHRFKAGHRIRLAIAGSSFPHYGRNPGSCEPVFALPAGAYRAVVQYVLRGPEHPSQLELPVIPLEAGDPWQAHEIGERAI